MSSLLEQSTRVEQWRPLVDWWTRLRRTVCMIIIYYVWRAADTTGLPQRALGRTFYRAALYYAWGPADVASETRRVCTHYGGASGSAHFLYSLEKIRPSKLSVERADPFSCILVTVVTKWSCQRIPSVSGCSPNKRLLPDTTINCCESTLHPYQ